MIVQVLASIVVFIRYLHDTMMHAFYNSITFNCELSSGPHQARHKAAGGGPYVRRDIRDEIASSKQNTKDVSPSYSSPTTEQWLDQLGAGVGLGLSVTGSYVCFR